MRLIGAGLRKLRRRMATWGAFLTTAALVALLYLLLGATAPQVRDQNPAQYETFLELFRFPTAYDNVLSMILGFGGFIVVIYAAAVIGSEWQWGTLGSAVARGESRTRYVLLLFAAIAVITALLLLVGFAVGLLASIGASAMVGISTAGMSDQATLAALPEKLVRVWIGMVELGAMGYAVASVTRSVVAGVGASLGLYFVSQFAAGLLPDVVRWLPFNAAEHAARLTVTSTATTSSHALDPNVALLVTVGWLVLGLAVAAVFTERAEITG